MEELSLQDQFALKSICYGCGPSNESGLQLKSFVQDQGLIACFQPKEIHQAFPGVLNGGIISTLLDCHANWTAAYFLMKRLCLKKPQCTVTARFTLDLLAPTPIDQAVTLLSSVVSLSDRKAIISAQLLCENKKTGLFEGIFIRVKEDHPAYGQW